MSFPVDTKKDIPSGPSIDGLEPYTPYQTGRWRSSASLVRLPRTIPCTLPSHNKVIPPYLPADWSSFVAPEGQRYFCRSGNQLVVVTEANMHKSEVRDSILAWVILIEELAITRSIYLSPSVELCVNFGATEGTLNYYFADHSDRSLFWLEDVNTDALSLTKSVSPSNLQYDIESNYWAFVEQFPCHSKVISVDTVDDLINTFLFGRADQLTSDESTFPYSPTECAAHLELLKDSRDRTCDPRIVWFVARVSSFIASSRCIGLYGEEHARLARSQSVIDTPAREESILFQMASWLLFQLPDQYRAQLEDLYVDDVMTIMYWRNFATEVTEEWKWSSHWALAILIVSIFMLPLSPIVALALVPALLCASSIVMGLVLTKFTEGYHKFDAGLAANFMEQYRTAYGYQGVATVFSLPKALLIWSIIAFIIQLLCLVFFLVHPLVALAIVVVVTPVAFAIYRTLWPRAVSESSKSLSSFYSLLRFWKRSESLKSEDEEDKLVDV